jgi:hypothetical protein
MRKSKRSGKEINLPDDSQRETAGRCCGSSESWRYFYSIGSPTAIREAAVPEDRVL